MAMSTRFKRLLGGALLALSLSSATAFADFSQPPAGWEVRNGAVETPPAPPVDDVVPAPPAAVPPARVNPLPLANLAKVADPIDKMTPAKAKAELARRRAINLKRLADFRKKGVFPQNLYIDGLVNLFRDEQGRLCAMATLIKASGRQDLVDAIALENNTVRMGEVVSGPLFDWILRSGLTLEEVGLIQLPDSRIGGGEDIIYRPGELPQPVLPTIVPASYEKKRITDHIIMVERRLQKDSKSSLKLALARLLLVRGS